jgi:ubiquinone/menaquinone biosynthesis C-methylase UbiE
MGSGTTELWKDDALKIHGVDIYITATVDVVCDAHYLPFDSRSYDGVWIQAVLEHVVEPQVVVSEIYRILKVNGLVYAETPFMQQVHEGAYDFTRYTVLGHRYLFKNFENISIGGIGGAHIAFSWSFRYLVYAITRSRSLSRLFGLISTLLLRPFKYFISTSSMFDASSGVFFLGRKTPNYKMSHKDLIRLYRGQM